LPRRQTSGSAGYDIRALSPVDIAPGQVALVATGLRIRLEPGYFLGIFSRSSMSVRRNLTLANGVGVVDADYYANADNGGHILVPLWNFGTCTQSIAKGERIAQGIVLAAGWLASDEPHARERQGGFGSTGRG
ncbi:MAG: dUTP diphosphatase, partial [Firmicutes bacterium]|nr:dUTP diphosphatase [Bacillota bacterium]